MARHNEPQRSAACCRIAFLSTTPCSRFKNRYRSSSLDPLALHGAEFLHKAIVYTTSVLATSGHTYLCSSRSTIPEQCICITALVWFLHVLVAFALSFFAPFLCRLLPKLCRFCRYLVLQRYGLLGNLQANPFIKTVNDWNSASLKNVGWGLRTIEFQSSAIVNRLASFLYWFELWKQFLVVTTKKSCKLPRRSWLRSGNQCGGLVTYLFVQWLDKSLLFILIAFATKVIFNFVAVSEKFKYFLAVHFSHAQIIADLTSWNRQCSQLTASAGVLNYLMDTVSDTQVSSRQWQT